MSKKIYELQEALLKKQYCFVDINNNIEFPSQENMIILNSDGESHSDPIYPFYIKRHDNGNGCVLIPANNTNLINERVRGTIIFKDKPVTSDGMISISAKEYLHLYTLSNNFNPFIMEDLSTDSSAMDNYRTVNQLFNSKKNTIQLSDLLSYKDSFIGKYVYIWDQYLDLSIFRCVDVKKELFKVNSSSKNHFKFIVGAKTKNPNVKERYKFSFLNDTKQLTVTIDINYDGEVVISENIPHDIIFTTMNAAAQSYQAIKDSFKLDLESTLRIVDGMVNSNSIDHALMDILNQLHEYRHRIKK